MTYPCYYCELSREYACRACIHSDDGPEVKQVLAWVDAAALTAALTAAQVRSLPGAARGPGNNDFIRRTNRDCAAWCSTYYRKDAINEHGMMSLHGLWAWQEQERRLDAAREAMRDGEPQATKEEKE
jgi:hypothetical protein